MPIQIKELSLKVEVETDKKKPAFFDEDEIQRIKEEIVKSCLKRLTPYTKKSGSDR